MSLKLQPIMKIDRDFIADKIGKDFTWVTENSGQDSIVSWGFV